MIKILLKILNHFQINPKELSINMDWFALIIKEIYQLNFLVIDHAYLI